MPDDGLPVSIQLNAESCRVDFQVIDDEAEPNKRGLEIIYRATKLGSHNNLTESFKVTTSEAGPAVGYVGRSYDALYQTGLYAWTDRYATVRITPLFSFFFHLPPSAFFQTHIVFIYERLNFPCFAYR